MNISEESVIEETMSDLYGVGQSKMLGYLPLGTVIQYCGQDLAKVTQTLVNKGLFVTILSSEECFIAGGAIYVAHLQKLQEFLCAPEQKSVLEDKQWPIDAKLFINKVANKHAADGTDLYDVIAMTFNSPLLTEKQRSHAYPKQDSALQDTVSMFDTNKISKIRENSNIKPGSVKIK